MHCYICNKEYTHPSFGGSGVCPRCDCGIPPQNDDQVCCNPIIHGTNWEGKCDICGSTTIDHTELHCQTNRERKGK